jgi:hypothetical protein
LLYHTSRVSDGGLPPDEMIDSFHTFASAINQFRPKSQFKGKVLVDSYFGGKPPSLTPCECVYELLFHKWKNKAENSSEMSIGNYLIETP